VQAARVTWQDAARTGTNANVKGVGKGTFFLVRALRIRLGGRLQQVMPAAPPGAGASSRLVDRHIVPLRCCILLLYQSLELWAQDFEFIYLTWLELRGFEPRTSCMPWEMRKFNCRQMPATGEQCRSNRAGHADDNGQMTVKTIFNNMDHIGAAPQRMVPGQAHEELGTPASPASRQTGANACTDGDNSGGASVVRRAPNAE
jgi:hypothetical protein